jgi:tetratricopeptide (TPR) repeat protein
VGAKLLTIERVLSVDKNYSWAIDQYEKLAEVNPSAQILSRLGILYFLHDKKAIDKALQQLERAKTYDPNYWEIYRSLTYIYTQTAQTKGALSAGEQALKLNRYDANTFNNLAWLYSTSEAECRNFDKAERYGTDAVALTESKNAQFLDTLAEVHFRKGNLEASRKYLREAIDVASASELPDLVKRFKDRFPNDEF